MHIQQIYVFLVSLRN